MNSICTHEVKTSRGWFRLDDGAYEDYLNGKLWINWTPEKAAQPQKKSETDVKISAESETLYNKAESIGAWETFRLSSDSEHGPVLSYLPRMAEISIEEMNLTVRALNGLMRSGIKTLGRLAEIMEQPDGIKRIRNLGAKSEQDIMKGFFELCYSKLSRREQKEFWQKIIS